MRYSGGGIDCIACEGLSVRSPKSKSRDVSRSVRFVGVGEYVRKSALEAPLRIGVS